MVPHRTPTANATLVMMRFISLFAPLGPLLNLRASNHYAP